jgi:hypothetical protein
MAGLRWSRSPRLGQGCTLFTALAKHLRENNGRARPRHGKRNNPGGKQGWRAGRPSGRWGLWPASPQVAPRRPSTAAQRSGSAGSARSRRPRRRLRPNLTSRGRMRRCGQAREDLSRRPKLTTSGQCRSIKGHCVWACSDIHANQGKGRGRWRKGKGKKGGENIVFSSANDGKIVNRQLHGRGHVSQAQGEVCGPSHRAPEKAAGERQARSLTRRLAKRPSIPWAISMSMQVVLESKRGRGQAWQEETGGSASNPSAPAGTRWNALAWR